MLVVNVLNLFLVHNKYGVKKTNINTTSFSNIAASFTSQEFNLLLLMLVFNIFNKLPNFPTNSDYYFVNPLKFINVSNSCCI